MDRVSNLLFYYDGYIFGVYILDNKTISNVSNYTLID
jgi:hypothetical protein